MSEFPKKQYFSKVREAREALKEKALEIYEKHMKLIDMALDTGDLEVASKHLQWLSEHSPREEGISTYDPSVDVPKQIDNSKKGPQIQIGIQLGGVHQPPELPSSLKVIELPTDTLTKVENS